MLVVSDTTPLVSLLKIDSLTLLKELFGEIYIPNAVFQELTENDSFPDEAQKIQRCDFIKITPVAKKESVTNLQNVTGLDLGESEAIVLAKELCADVLLIDERKGRDVARQLDVRITGTIGILLLASESGIVTSHDLFLFAQTLRDSGRFISEELFRKLLGN